MSNDWLTPSRLSLQFVFSSSWSHRGANTLQRLLSVYWPPLELKAWLTRAYASRLISGLACCHHTDAHLIVFIKNKKEIGYWSDICSISKEFGAPIVHSKVCLFDYQAQSRDFCCLLLMLISLNGNEERIGEFYYLGETWLYYLASQRSSVTS